MKEIKKALTFDDVLLKPHYSEVLPKETEVNVVLSNKFEMNIPVFSAGMDTVTEIDMAFNMALNGGVGVIHKNLSISKQANMVKQIKHIKNGLFWSIMAFESTNKIETIKTKIFDEYLDDCIFVTVNGNIVNIVSVEDLENKKINFDSNLESLPRNKLVLAKDSNSLEEILAMMEENNVNYVPIISESSNGLVAVAKKKWLVPYLEAKNQLLDTKGKLKVLGAVGVAEDSLERAKMLIAAGADGIVIDSAHGHSKKVIDLIKDIKRNFPKIFLIAGNVVAKEGVNDLHKAGADVIKVGVGPGSICTTRIVSGVGVPQFSAILECAEAAKKLNISIIADGGIKTSGDITKALAAGANAIMLGGLLAGSDESPSNKVVRDDKIYKQYRGMGSIAAMKAGSSDRYGQEGIKKLVAEGVEGLVPYTGPVKDTLFNLIGGLRSGMGYLGAKTIEKLQENAEFIEQSFNGLKESSPHSIINLNQKFSK
ncbi:MAG: IMP dehydrogenase [Malacoplasma sp.]|nr:IMP dehydrogenase [Malacoplasma sp.]MDE7112081.1 IMP dehydrogenase [Malacoplasma sp.]